MANVLEELNERILIADGATGTYLASLGLAHDACLEEANLTRQDLVSRVYAEYATAGARVIETNTFGANALRLARFGLEKRVNEINWTAARLARDAVKGLGSAPIYIGGSVGPLSLRPTDPFLTDDDKKAIFREQIGALLDGGCNLIFLETFSDLAELRLALNVFQNLTNIPVACSLATTEEGRLATGETVAAAFRQLREDGADICSLNGSCGPQASLHVLSTLEIGPDDLVGVFPNAGKPEFYEGRFNYAASPAYFAENLPRFVAEGARLIGGDYGTTPAHIAAMVEALGELKPRGAKPSSSSRRITVTTPGQEKATQSILEPSLLDLWGKKTVQVVELDSPKTLSMDKFLVGAQALKQAGADAITLADNSLAILRISNFAAALKVKEVTGITPMLHLACRDRNLIGIQSELMGFSVFGLRHVLALTGDPAKVGDHPGATSVYDLNSVGLLKLLSGLNKGVNATGKSLGQSTNFVIGCAFNPNALNFDSQVKKLEGKIAAGAQYILTQPIFDAALIRKTAERLRPLGLPVFIGVMPLLHARNAEFLHNEVPGISIPESVRESLRHSEEKEAWKIGLSFARDLRRAVLSEFPGIYLITPFLRYELSVELLANS
jgi:methionine synthase / methylenetetrahydrofolate reductase(NADPH)